MAKTGTFSSSVSVTRRGFLSAGTGSIATWTMAGIHPVQAQASSSDFHCIFLNLVGGPSHLDTWDPKPNAPSEYRGPFKAIRTRVPGIWISELFPRMARLAHHYALVRSLYHDEAPIHETGQQLIQAGRIAESCQTAENLTSILIPGPIRNTGVDISHGQDAIISHISPDRGRGIWELGREPSALREQYGLNPFGQSCLLARRMVEQGIPLITVNMFDTVYDSVSWDCHADGSALNVNLNDYRDILGPMFDLAYSNLLMDLVSRGLLLDACLECGACWRRRSRRSDYWFDGSIWQGAD
jgi:hypothetical protein